MLWLSGSEVVSSRYWSTNNTAWSKMDTFNTSPHPPAHNKLNLPYFEQTDTILTNIEDLSRMILLLTIVFWARSIKNCLSIANSRVHREWVNTQGKIWIEYLVIENQNFSLLSSLIGVERCGRRRGWISRYRTEPNEYSNSKIIVCWTKMWFSLCRDFPSLVVGVRYLYM